MELIFDFLDKEKVMVSDVLKPLLFPYRDLSFIAPMRESPVVTTSQGWSEVGLARLGRSYHLTSSSHS